MAQRLAEKVVQRPDLRVLPRGTAMVPDYRALMEARTRRFHGWKLNPQAGPKVLDEAGRETDKHHGGFEQLTDAPISIPGDDPHWVEYVRHLRDGDLWAADTETAQAAGVAFEADFGGEHRVASKITAKVEEAVAVSTLAADVKRPASRA